MEKTSEVSSGQVFVFIARTLLHALGFAIAGAIGLAFVGAFCGIVTGPIYLLLVGVSSRAMALGSRSFRSFVEDILLSMLIAGFVAVVDALVCGALAFFVVGLLSTKLRFPWFVWKPTFRRAARGAVVGVAIGGFVGVVNWFLLSLIVDPAFLRAASFPMRNAAGAFQIGVIVGFAGGTFVGAIRGALGEVKQRQMDEHASESTPE